MEDLLTYIWTKEFIFLCNINIMMQIQENGLHCLSSLQLPDRNQSMMHVTLLINIRNNSISNIFCGITKIILHKTHQKQHIINNDV